MFGKNHILRYYEQSFFKLFNHIIAFKSLHIHNFLHYLPLMSFVIKSLKAFFCISSYAETLLRQKTLIPDPFC